MPKVREQEQVNIHMVMTSSSMKLNRKDSIPKDKNNLEGEVNGLTGAPESTVLEEQLTKMRTRKIWNISMMTTTKMTLMKMSQVKMKMNSITSEGKIHTFPFLHFHLSNFHPVQIAVKAEAEIEPKTGPKIAAKVKAEAEAEFTVMAPIMVPVQVRRKLALLESPMKPSLHYLCLIISGCKEI